MWQTNVANNPRRFYHRPSPIFHSLLSYQVDKYFVIDLLSRHCRVEYYPSKSPDLCWEAVRTCPDAANSELKMLCERGPSNYINITNCACIGTWKCSLRFSNKVQEDFCKYSRATLNISSSLSPISVT